MALDEKGADGEEVILNALDNILAKANAKGLAKLLFKAIAEHDVESARNAIKAGADVNARDEFGWSSLHRAAARGHPEMADFLIEQGAQVNGKNGTGQRFLALPKFIAPDAVVVIPVPYQTVGKLSANNKLLIWVFVTAELFRRPLPRQTLALLLCTTVLGLAAG